MILISPSLPPSLPPSPPSFHLSQQQEKRIEDAIRSIRQQYEDVLERKQEEYVEKYKHLQYIEVRTEREGGKKGGLGGLEGYRVVESFTLLAVLACS